MANASTVNELMVRWQELRDRGRIVSGEELCAGCPELLEDVKRHIQALASMEHFLGASGGERPSTSGRTEEPPADEAAAILARGRLGGYRIKGRLGSGGMGMVFLGEDLQLGRPVALKVMRPSVATSAAARQRFLREARAMAAVKHPHVITIYQVDEDSGTPFLAMELLQGESLETCLERVGRLSTAEVLRLGLALAEGLVAAHERGVIHRDIKPTNIWLESHGVKILDFGLARAGTDDAHLTGSGMIVGTPRYMAPEQARSQPVDGRCDLFSLGSVLYRALTGQVPFRGADALSTMLAVTSSRPMPPRQLCPEIPQALSDLVMWMLEKDPAARPASAREVADRLGEIERLQTVKADLQATSVLTPVRHADVPEISATVWKRRWIIAAAVGVMFLLSLGLVIRPARDDKDVGGQASGSQAPPEKARAAITPANAAQVELITELPRDVREIAWGPAPGQVALLGAESCVEVLDADTFKPLRTIATGRRLVHFAFSPNGEAVAWSERSKKVEIHDLRTDKSVVLETENQEPTLAFSPDGKLMATGGADATRAEVWDTVSGELVGRFDCGPEGMLDVAFRPKGKQLAIGNRNGQTHLYDVATGKRRYVLPRAMSHELKFSPDGSLLAVAYVDGSVALWDVAGGELLHNRATAEEVFSLDWSPAGDVLATAGLNGTITLWDARDMSVLKEFKCPPCGVPPVIRMSPDGSRILVAVGTIEPAADRKLLVFGLSADGEK